MNARTRNLFDSVFLVIPPPLPPPSIVYRLNNNIFDKNIFKLQWFKEYLFCRLDSDPKRKDWRDNVSKVAA